MPSILNILQTKPRKIGELLFSVVTEVEWQMPKNEGRRSPYAVRLRIDNPNDKEILFPTFDTIIPKLAGGGKPIEFGGARKATRASVNILVPAGGRFSYPLSADLSFSPSRKRDGIHMFDETGMNYFAAVRPGRYTISFDLVPLPLERLASSLPPPVWSGKGSLEPAKFQVVQATR